MGVLAIPLWKRLSIARSKNWERSRSNLDNCILIYSDPKENEGLLLGVVYQRSLRKRFVLGVVAT